MEIGFYIRQKYGTISHLKNIRSLTSVVPSFAWYIKV